MLRSAKSDIDTQLADQLLRTLSQQPAAQLELAGTNNPELVRDWLEQLTVIENRLRSELASCQRIKKDLESGLRSEIVLDLAA